ncbi:MAG: hypothetical protein WC773_03410 [Patescibacteria group bacterium]|jgi:hypothetical protein
MLKKLLIAGVAITLIGVIVLVVLNYRSKNSSSSQTPVVVSPIAAPTDFHWGAQLRAYNLSTFDAAEVHQSIADQIALAKELKLTDIRANIEASDVVNDDFVNQTIAAGLNPVVIIEPNYSVAGFNRQSAYDYAYKYALRYKGKVHYYQLANEASGVTLKPTHGGDKTDDYDVAKYQAFKELLLGFSEGVYAADPAAKRIISSNWVGVAVIDKLITDQVKFEVIGWNWYSSMGNDLIVKASGNTLNIPEYLKKYGKPIWVVELNRTEGTLDGNLSAQSDFLYTFINNTLSHNNINGIFVYLLTDQCAELSKGVGNMGIVKLIKSGTTCTLGDKKPAFTTYKNIISQ